MRKIAIIAGADMRGKVYQSDGGLFYYKADVMYRDQNNDERWRSMESPKFSDLEALISSLPHPRLFRHEGDAVYDPAEMAVMAKRSKKGIEELRKHNSEKA